MTALLPLVAALGLLLLYDGVTVGRSRSPRTKVFDRLASSAHISGLNGRRLMLLVMGSGPLALLLVAGATGSLAISVPFGLAASYAPIGYVRSRADRRIAAIREEWPDTLAHLVSAVRAGVSLPEACVGLAQRKDGGLQPGFDSFARAYRASGRFQAGLDALRRTIADPICDRVVLALTLADEVGGSHLVRTLRTLSDMIREDLRVRKEIEARWSWTVTAARLAAGAPWIVLLLVAAQPEGSRAFRSMSGALVIACGAAAVFIGYRLMLRAARLPRLRRLDA